MLKRATPALAIGIACVLLLVPVFLRYLIYSRNGGTDAAIDGALAIASMLGALVLVLLIAGVAGARVFRGWERRVSAQATRLGASYAVVVLRTRSLKRKVREGQESEHGVRSRVTRGLGLLATVQGLVIINAGRSTGQTETLQEVLKVSWSDLIAIEPAVVVEYLSAIQGIECTVQRNGVPMRIQVFTVGTGIGRLFPLSREATEAIVANLSRVRQAR